MINLIIIFLLFIFLFLPTCYNFGNLILDKLKIELNKYLKIFVGFFSIIALFQIIYYPAMTLQLSSSYLKITGLLISVFLLGLDIVKIKDLKQFYFDKKVLFTLFLSCIIFFIYMRTMPHDYWYYDDSFYLPLMFENSDTSKLLSIQPRTGEVISKLINLYATQGYYMIGSFLISIFNVIKNVFGLNTVYVFVVYYFMAFPIFIMLVNLYFGLSSEICKNKWQKVLFAALFIFFSIVLPIDCNLLNDIFMTGYVGPFVSLTIILPFIIFSLFKYFNGERSYSKLLAILFFALLSIASFNIFIILIILYILLFMQFIFKKKNNLADYMVLLFPELIFVADFVIESNILAFALQVLIILIYVVYYLLRKYILKLEKNIFTILKYVVYIIPVIFFFLSALMMAFGENINCTTYEYIENIINTIIPLFGTLEFHYSYILITMFYLIYFIIIAYVFKHKDKNIKPVLYFALILLLTFLNPLNIAFVSSYITSETYNRVYILILNPYITYLIISYAVQKFNLVKFKKISKDMIVIIVCVLLSLATVIVQLKEFNYWVVRNGRSNKLYRMRDEDIVASEKIVKYAKNNNIKNIKISTTHSELKIMNPKIKALYDRTVVFEPNEEFTKEAYYISVLYNLNRGVIKQEYYSKYKENDLISIIKYFDVNFITIDTKCPQREENYTSNVLCQKPNLDKENPLAYENELSDYNEDKKIFKELKKHLKLVYKTDRYKIYYVKER